jgi:hypothetical protein
VAQQFSKTGTAINNLPPQIANGAQQLTICPRRSLIAPLSLLKWHSSWAWQSQRSAMQRPHWPMASIDRRCGQSRC